MGDSVTPEILGNMIRKYFCQVRTEEETIQALNHLRRVCTGASGLCAVGESG